VIDHFVIESLCTTRYNELAKMKKENENNTPKRQANAAGASLRQNRIVHRAHSFQEAREWEILQELSMTPGQRQWAAKALKERFYGKNSPDVREAHRSR